MAVQHNKRRKSKTKEENSSNTILHNSFTSNAIEFRQNIDVKKNIRTDLSLWPSCIIAGFNNENEIFIEYPARSKSERAALDDALSSQNNNLNEISAFFSEMKLGDTFDILNASYDDGIIKSTKIIEGTYEFISYPQENQIVAKKTSSSLDSNMRRKRLGGKYFNKCIQFENNKQPKSKKEVSVIINYLSTPHFNGLNLEIGDIIEPKGTKNNDIKYTIIGKHYPIDGTQTLLVTPQVKNENRISKITSFKHWKLSLIHISEPTRPY